jgi:hypothetical protein
VPAARRRRRAPPLPRAAAAAPPLPRAAAVSAALHGRRDRRRQTIDDADDADSVTCPHRIRQYIEVASGLQNGDVAAVATGEVDLLVGTDLLHFGDLGLILRLQAVVLAQRCKQERVEWDSQSTFTTLLCRGQ